MNKVAENHTQNSLKRRYLTSVSVQIVIALVFVFGLYWFNRQKPVKIVRHTVYKQSVPTANKPSLKQLLEWRTKLELTNQQEKQLLALNKERIEAINSIDKKINKEMNLFKQKIEAKNNSSKRLSMNVVSNIASPAVSLGRKKRRLLHEYNSKGLALLTKDQFKKAKVLLSKELREGSDADVF